MNLREWRGMGTGSSRRADICYYTYIRYAYSIYLYGWSINFLQLLPTCDICHCISIAGGTFQLHETGLTIVSLKHFWQQKISEISFWEALHHPPMVQIACARELDFFMLSPGMLRISLMPTRTALWTNPQIWQFKRPWLQWRLLKGISFILQTMILI